MIPFSDTAPRYHTPWVTWALIVINVAVFAFTKTLSQQGLIHFLNLFGVVPCRFAGHFCLTPFGVPEGSYTPFITSIFIHENALHLVLNLWLLWLFGDNVEDRMGPLRYIAFYLLCGLAAGGFYVYANQSSTTPTIGASGAIAGVMGAYFFLFPNAKVIVWVFFLPLFLPVPAMAVLQLWMIYQLYKATTLATGGEPLVGWWAHVGGFIVGMLSYRLFLLRERDPAVYSEHVDEAR